MPAEVPSSAITAIQTKDTADRHIFNGLIERYQTYIMPGSVPGFYRISHTWASNPTRISAYLPNASTHLNPDR